MLDFILKRFRPFETQDDFFGRLVYIRIPRGPHPSYWEAKRTFGPTGKEIDLLIDAPAERQPPSERQRDFYRKVEQHYPDLLAAAEAAVLPELEAWIGRPLDKPIRDDLTMTGFSIPDADLRHTEWDMAFDSASDMSHFINVYFEGMKPTLVSFDG